jgi:phage shock protein C
MQRKLERSRTNSRIAGVCGGLGEYLDVDPTLVRLAFVLLALYGGHGILLYIVLMLVMPPQEAAVATPPKAE